MEDLYQYMIHSLKCKYPYVIIYCSFYNIFNKN